MGGLFCRQGNQEERVTHSFTSRERNETVRKALDFYRQFSDELQPLKEAACEMWELLLSGAVGTGETVHQEEDDRLFQALDKFLSF